MPERLVLVEQAACPAERFHVGLDDLATTRALLGNQTGPLEDGDVLLHGREAHRVVPGDLGNAFGSGYRAEDDVTTGGIGQRGKGSIGVERDLHRNNHTVVRYTRQEPQGPPDISGRRR